MDSKDGRTGPVRVLHVLGGMNRAGLETWLMHVLRHTDRNRFRMDFLVHTVNPCDYDDEIRSLGSEIIPCLHPTRPWAYACNFGRILREHGPYDVVHSHVHHFSGYVLRLAHRAGVPIRISHSHSDTSTIDARSGPARRAYLTLMRWWIDRYATLGMAASGQAAAALFGPAWVADPRWRLFYCSVDLSPFRSAPAAGEVRAELGIPADAFVIGHVGRFIRVKNHEFLIEILAELIKRESKAYLLLVGDGELRPHIERRVIDLSLSDRVIFLGIRSDVPRVMQGVMDVYLFPSSYEGLPVTLIEAQAAGLPSVISDVISEEAVIVKPLARRLSLSQPASSWAEAVLACRNGMGRHDRQEALGCIEGSSFDIALGARNLVSFYQY